MSNNSNDRYIESLHDRACSMMDYWTSTLHSKLIEYALDNYHAQNSTKNLEELIYAVERAERERYGRIDEAIEHFHDFNLIPDGERDFAED